MKIAASGVGYTRLSNAMLLAEHHDVVALDIIQEIFLINQLKSPIFDARIEDFLEKSKPYLKATIGNQDLSKASRDTPIEIVGNVTYISGGKWTSKMPLNKKEKSEVMGIRC